MNRHFFAAFPGSHERCRHNRQSAAHAGKTARFRETAKFDGTIARALDFVDRTRQIATLNVIGIRGVEQNDGIVLQRVIDPRL